MKKTQAEIRGDIVRFLKANPLSTTDEIRAGTGHYLGIGIMKKGIFKNVLYNGKRCWRVSANCEQFIK